MISAQATDPPELSRYRRSKARAEGARQDVQGPGHPLRVVVVKDMWLTGFDAPVLHTLYVDKPMRDHGLLQAIARVNRVFRDKPGGLVVDYIGIGEDLRASLQRLRRRRHRRPRDPRARRRSPGCGEKYEVICALLHPAGYRQGELHLAANQAALFRDCATTYLARDRGALPRVPRRSRLRSPRWYALCAHPAGGDRAPRRGRLLRQARGRGAEDHHARRRRQARRPSRRSASSCPKALRPGEVIDVLRARRHATGPRSRSSPTSSSTRSPRKTDHQNVQVRLLEKLLNDEIRSAPQHQPDAGQAVLREGRRGPRAATSCGSSQAPRSSSGSSSSPRACATPGTATSSSASPSRRPRSTTRSPAASRTSSRRPAARDDRAGPRQGHPRRPHGRLGRPRGHRGRDPPQDQAAPPPAQLPAAAAGGWRWRRRLAQLLHSDRARPGEGALAVLARHRGGAAVPVGRHRIAVVDPSAED